MKVSVIGGMNIDWMFHVNQELKYQDSNPATHEVAFGGVGRNMAINFKLLHYDVTLYSVLPEDDMGKALQTKTCDLGVILRGVKVKQSPIYMSIFNPSGNMQVAVASMNSMDQLKVKHLLPYEKDILSSDVIVVDANVHASIIEYVSTLNHPFKVFEGVSTSKVIKVKPYIEGYQLIKTNALEKEALFHHLSDLEIQQTLQKDQTLIVTQGEEGAFLITSNEIQFEAPKSIRMINVSGAGDAFIVGAIHGILNNVSALKTGHKMARCALLSPSTQPDLKCIEKEIL